MNAAEVANNVRLALAEDIGTGDLTGALTPAGTSATAEVILKESAVICGIPWFEESFRQLDPEIRIDWHCQDGDRRTAGSLVCRLSGSARAILSAERTALNFLQTLSGTATAAAEFVALVAGTGVTVLDTRKTIPGLRHAQKYAVRCGGAENHRIGLFDAVLIKENHLQAIGSIALAVQKARDHADGQLIEIEVETLDQALEALATDADRLLLDEFSLDMLREIVRLRDERGATQGLEASGNITHQNIRAIAETGVDYVSTGEITKNVRAIDLSLRIV